MVDARTGSSLSTFGGGFIRSMQHIASCQRSRSVADDAKAAKATSPIWNLRRGSFATLDGRSDCIGERQQIFIGH